MSLLMMFRDENIFKNGTKWTDFWTGGKFSKFYDKYGELQY